TACDTVYFESYFPKLAHSLERHSPGVALHLHIFNPPDERFIAQIEQLKKLCPHILVTLTWEEANMTGRDRIYRVTYFASMRFLRLYQLMMTVRRDVLSIDVDTLVRGELSTLTR